MKWPMVRLGDVAPAKSIKNSEINNPASVWLLNLDMIESNTGKVIEKHYCSIDEAGSSTHWFDEQHVLYSKLRPYLNKVVLPDALGLATTELVPMLPDPKRLDRKYLYYYLRSEQFVLWINEQVAGAKMPRVSMNIFWAHEIPLPPLEEQKRIAAILDKVDAIRHKRQQAIALADDFLRSLFLDMFGDPVTNLKGIKTLPMTDIFHIRTGKLNSNAAVEGGAYPFFTCAKEVYQIDHYAFDQEALLLAGNNAQADYDVKHYIGKFNAYQRTYVLSLVNKDWSYPFFKFALEFQLSNLKASSKGSNTKYITMEIMSRTMLPVPSPDDQRKFVMYFKQQMGSRSRLEKFQLKSSGLFSSLNQQAFSGQL